MLEVCQSCTDFFGGDHFVSGEMFTHKLDVELVSGMCQQARLAEQNRIIKLLDDLAFIDEMGDVMIGEFKSDVIALIKGE